jgi:hypothetical protein
MRLECATLKLQGAACSGNTELLLPRRKYWRILTAMDYADYLREQAAKYRELAAKTDDPLIKQELLDLASVCEDVADTIEDHLTGG